MRGLKRAFSNIEHGLEQRNGPLPNADLAASFRRAVCTELMEKAELLLKNERTDAFALAGGVSANRELRRMAAEMCKRRNVKLFMPDIPLCTDNGAMIGSAAYYRLMRGEIAALNMNAEPALRLVNS